VKEGVRDCIEPSKTIGTRNWAGRTDKRIKNSKVLVEKREKNWVSTMTSGRGDERNPKPKNRTLVKKTM